MFKVSSSVSAQHTRLGFSGVKDRSWEQVILVINILIVSGAWLRAGAGTLDPLSKEILLPLLNLFSYLFVCFILFKHGKKIINLFVKEKFLALLILLTLASTLWSSDLNSALTLFRGATRVTLLGAYLAVNYSLSERLRLLAWAMAIIVLISLPLCIVLPDYGFHSALSGCRGLLAHKNHLGRITLLSSIVFFIFLLEKRRLDVLRWFLFGSSFGLLILTNSKTSLVGFFITLIAFPLQRALRQRYKARTFLLISLGLSLLVIATLTSIYYVHALAAIGKDSTFTGRLPLWTILVDKIQERPFWGYGFEGFWATERDYVHGRLFSLGTTWEAGHAHNGFIETALNTGLIGLSLFLMSFFAAIARSLRLLRTSYATECLWTTQYLLCFIVVNITVESTIVFPDLIWMLYVSTAMSLAANSKLRDRNAPSTSHSAKAAIT